MNLPHCLLLKSFKKLLSKNKEIPKTPVKHMKTKTAYNGIVI